MTQPSPDKLNVMKIVPWQRRFAEHAIPQDSISWVLYQKKWKRSLQIRQRSLQCKHLQRRHISLFCFVEKFVSWQGYYTNIGLLEKGQMSVRAELSMWSFASCLSQNGQHILTRGDTACIRVVSLQGLESHIYHTLKGSIQSEAHRDARAIWAQVCGTSDWRCLSQCRRQHCCYDYRSS